jgi:exoribonuclease R
VAGETQVTLTYDSNSLFQALRQHLGDWRMNDHAFNSSSDEVRVSYDSGGSGRVAVTFVFELDQAAMERLLSAARTPS